MQFSTRKRRNPPGVIIVSLIDVLIVVLIFLMVASTLKQHPALKLALPESKQAAMQSGADDNIVVSIASQDPPLYIGPRPVTLDKLQQELTAKAAQNPKVSLSIHSDKRAAVEYLFKVMDAAKAAGIRNITAATKPAGPP
jgi:biopolymer transport protein ExbD